MRTGSSFKVRVKKWVHEGAFAETGFTNAKYVEHKSILHAFIDELIGKAVKPHMAT